MSLGIQSLKLPVLISSMPMPVYTWWNYSLVAGKFNSAWQENSKDKKISAVLETRGHIPILSASIKLTQFTINFWTLYLEPGLMHKGSLAVGSLSALNQWATRVSELAKQLRSSYPEAPRKYESNMFPKGSINFISKSLQFFSGCCKLK